MAELIGLLRFDQEAGQVRVWTVHAAGLPRGCRQTAKLVANDAAPVANFGSSVDIENSTIVIGARLDSETEYRSGAVYIFNEQVVSLMLPDRITKKTMIVVKLELTFPAIRIVVVRSQLD